MLIHFNLHNELIVGKKKCIDIQFYIEAGSQAEDIDSRFGRRRSNRGDFDDDRRLK